MHAALHVVGWVVGASSGSSNTSTGSPFGLVFILLIGVAFYLLLIRPRSRQMRAERELLSSLEVGDEVITRSGMFGRIVELDDEAVVLEVAPGIQLRFVRAAVGRRLTEPEDEDSEEDQEAGESS